MDLIHKKVVKFDLTKIEIDDDLNQIDMEYSFKDDLFEFYNTFTIKVTNLHDILFGYVKIIFSKQVKTRSRFWEWQKSHFLLFIA